MCTIVRNPTGKSANDVLELEIGGPRVPTSDYNTEFSLHFESIPFTPKAIRKFMEKLSQALSPHIQVHSFAESNNHVLFKWFNTSNPSTEHEVTEIRKVMLSDDGPVNKRLFEHFTPEFNVSVASVIPLRGLLSENNPAVDGGATGYGNNFGDYVAGGGASGTGNQRGAAGGGNLFSFDQNENGGGGGGFSGGGGSSNNNVGGGDGGIQNIVNVDNYRYAGGEASLSVLLLWNLSKNICTCVAQA